MFTGIIEETGEIVEVRSEEGGRRFWVGGREVLSDLERGSSIALNGVCLTVERLERSSHRFQVFAVGETLKRTTAGGWRTGTKVNLERAVRPADRLGGHMVQGHVDGVGRVRGVAPAGSARTIRLEIPGELRHLAAQKGSVAVDGVSLTVGNVLAWGCELHLIPETLKRTTLGSWRGGERVNLEMDLLARYLFRLVESGFLQRTTSRGHSL